MADCTFYFRGYFSPSGYQLELETDGIREDVESPFQYAQGATPCDYHYRVTVKPGQHIFVRNVLDEDTKACLITVPDGDDFQKFLEKAKAANEEIYQRIAGYKNPRHKGPYNHTHDFGGQWLGEFVTRSWDARTVDQEEEEVQAVPCDLAEALAS